MGTFESINNNDILATFSDDTLRKEITEHTAIINVVTGSPRTMQRLMTGVLRELLFESALVYINDIHGVLKGLSS